MIDKVDKLNFSVYNNNKTHIFLVDANQPNATAVPIEDATDSLLVSIYICLFITQTGSKRVNLN